MIAKSVTLYPMHIPDGFLDAQSMGATGAPAVGVLAAAFVFAASAVWAGRPLVIDDAEPVAPGRFELEAGGRFIDDHHFDHWDYLFNLAFGVVPWLEFGVGFGGMFEERLIEAEGGRHDRAQTHDWADVTPNIKWKPLDAEKAWADHAFAFTVKVPTANYDKGMGSGELDYDLTYIMTKPITEKMSGHLNVGHTWVTDPPGEDLDNILHYGVALDYQLTETLQLVGEVYANTPLHTVDETPVIATGGARWKVAEDLVLDFAAGTDVRRGETHLVATFGLTWTFGFDGKK